jgi:hypothetical protein
MLIVYRPKTQDFGTWGVPQGDLPVAEVLLLNILIELQVQSAILKDANPSLDLDSLEIMRADAVGN